MDKGYLRSWVGHGFVSWPGFHYDGFTGWGEEAAPALAGYFINKMLYNRNWPTWIGYGLAILVFVIAAIYAVSYATGYRLNLQTLTVQKTGVLAITTHPSGADITLAGKSYPRRTPLALRNLLPGTYDLEIKLDSYRTHTQRVVIESGAATEISDVDLVLGQPIETVVSERAQLLIAADDDAQYFDAENKLYRYNQNGPTEVTLDRAPEHVRNILASTTNINWVVPRGNNSLATNLSVGSRQWLVVMDTNGTTGAAFGAPINQAELDQTWWIDADRMLFLIGTNLHTLDLTANEVTLYARNVSHVNLLDNRLYFVAPGADQKPAVWTDSNLFDERAAEELELTLPAGREFELVEVTEKDLIVLVGSPGSQAIWWVGEVEAEDAPDRQTRIAAEVSSWLYDAAERELLYMVRDRLMTFALEEELETQLKAFGDNPIRLLERRGESIFALNRDGLVVLNPTAENEYLASSAKMPEQIHIGNNARVVWTLVEGVLTKIELRKMPGLFGFLRSGVS